MKQKLLASAINELLKIDETVQQLQSMIEELIDEEQIAQCKAAYKKTK